MGLVRALVKLSRPGQWAKSAFVLLGPLYGLQDPNLTFAEVWQPALITAVAFALASSASYIVNDVMDAEQDRAHPRKRNRPIASGAISAQAALIYALVLIGVVAGLLFLLAPSVRPAVMVLVGVYVLNVWAYSLKLKHIVIADVMSLSLGFVLRMCGGCAAIEIAPTTWLLNCTLFLAMFLAFGKRLGERRTMGEAAPSARGVQAAYTDELLRMAVVVTAVATLITYAGYVVFRAEQYTYVVPPFHAGFNLMWITIVPATYALLRAIVLLERGTYDDPTELAAKDPPMQLAVLAFGVVTGAVVTWDRWAPW
jgi:4-hydroxybenzoate polyprenyltransferase